MHIPSMMLDAKKDKPIEVEVIVGEVVRMARSAGVDIPVSTFDELHLCRHADRGL